MADAIESIQQAVVRQLNTIRCNNFTLEDSILIIFKQIYLGFKRYLKTFDNKYYLFSRRRNTRAPDILLNVSKHNVALRKIRTIDRSIQ